MIYIAGNSVPRRGDTIYADLVGATFLQSFHSEKLPGCKEGLYTILSADEETENLEINDDDYIVLHIGHNECIYRKDNKVQASIFQGLVELSEGSKYHQFFIAMNSLFTKKKEDDLIQMLSFKEFEDILDKVLSRFHGHNSIVVPINTHKEEYEAEWKRTNEILQKQAEKHYAHFIPLFDLSSTDGIHITNMGHALLADKILGVMNWR